MRVFLVCLVVDCELACFREPFLDVSRNGCEIGCWIDCEIQARAPSNRTMISSITSDLAPGRP